MIINNAGCHCPEFLAHSRFEGHMPVPEMPEPCAPLFLKWSAAARDRYMHTGPLRGCGTQLQRRCMDQRKHANAKTRMARDKKDVAERHKDFKLKKLIGNYDRGLNKATAQIGKLETELRVPQYDYVHIPGLKLTGKEMTGMAAAACRQHCSTHGNCKSYSYSETSQKCFWADAKLDYDPGFNMYLKVRQKGNSNKDFFTIPGLKSQEDDTTTPENQEITSFGECKYACFKNEECGAFSYNAQKSICLGEGEGMIYDTDYHYYEKSSTLEGGTKMAQEKMQIAVTNENSVKDKLRKEWVKIVAAQRKMRQSKGMKKWHEEDSTEAEGGELGSSQSSGKHSTASKGWSQMQIPGLVDVH